MPSAVTVPAPARVLLFGLDASTVAELSELLHDMEVASAPLSCTKTLSEMTRNGVVFCPSDSEALPYILDATRDRDVAVVVVSRNPHVGEWLDAMEAGAADYAAAPFERRQIEWILETNLRSSR